MRVRTADFCRNGPTALIIKGVKVLCSMQIRLERQRSSMALLEYFRLGLTSCCCLKKMKKKLFLQGIHGNEKDQ